MRKLFGLIVLSITMLTGCLQRDAVDESNPELVAVAFFDALYNQKDVNKAAQLCSPQMGRIVMHYQSADAVARHLFNMKFDTVEVTPDSSGVKVREQFKDEARIIVFFEGEYNGTKIKDVKQIHMLQIDGDWYVNKILKDPF